MFLNTTGRILPPWEWWTRIGQIVPLMEAEGGGEGSNTDPRCVLKQWETFLPAPG